MTTSEDTTRGSATAPELKALADGLWRRLRDVIMVAERVEGFSFGQGAEGEPDRTALGEDDAGEIARQFVLRALRVAGDAPSWAILERAAAAGQAGVTIDELAAAAGAPRIVVTERIADLLQSGLMNRALDSDRAFATGAGEALVAVVGAVVADLAEAARTRRRGPAGNGLPLL